MAKSIYEKIEKKAVNDAQEIIRLGQEKAKQIEENLLSSTKLTIENNLDKVRAKGEELLKTKTTELEQNVRQKTLLKKKELIKNTFANMLERLNQLDDAKLSKLVKKLLLIVNLKGDEILYVNQRDYQRYLQLFSSKQENSDNVSLDKLNKELGKKYNLQLGKDAVDIAGGLIVVGQTFDVDLSFETILKSLQEKHETEIAELLFERGE
ncbi:MAG: V-type ATP synthase subunit E family protein [Bacilli bacterium]|nr:V-type ATP synthase subunit E family protein [Bacilli bacterium]